MSKETFLEEFQSLSDSIIYISYDGVLEPLGQSQVLPYVESFALNRDVYLISYEKKSDLRDLAEIGKIRRRLSNSRVHWYPKIYHKKFTIFSTTWDVLVGLILGLTLVLRHKILIIHARSYVAAVIALGIKKITGSRYVFDMRGF